MADVHDLVRAFALPLPEAVEDFPWGESVAKVGGKVFVLLGPREGAPMTARLVESHAHALSVDGAEPTRYGLGPSGRVTVPTADLDVEVVCRRVEESYRVVAPKRLVATLDAG